MGYDNKSMQELKDLRELYKKRHEIFKIAFIVAISAFILTLFLLLFGFVGSGFKPWMSAFAQGSLFLACVVCGFFRERYKKKLLAVDKAIIKVGEDELEAMKNKMNDTGDNQ